MNKYTFFLLALIVLAFTYFHTYTSGNIQPVTIDGATYTKKEITIYNNENLRYITGIINNDKAIIVKKDIFETEDNSKIKSLSGTIELLIPIKEIASYNNVQDHFNKEEESIKQHRIDFLLDKPLFKWLFRGTVAISSLIFVFITGTYFYRLRTGY